MSKRYRLIKRRRIEEQEEDEKQLIAYACDGTELHILYFTYPQLWREGGRGYLPAWKYINDWCVPKDFSVVKVVEADKPLKINILNKK